VGRQGKTGKDGDQMSEVDPQITQINSRKKAQNTQNKDRYKARAEGEVNSFGRS